MSKKKQSDGAPVIQWVTKLPEAKDYNYWSERFKNRQTEYSQTKEVLTNNIELTLPDDSIIVFFGDQHIGSPEVDYKRIETEVAKILETPNTYVILMGDTIDGYFWGGEAQYEQVEQVPEQYQYVNSMINLLAEKGKLIGGILGDHCFDEDTEVFTKRGWLTHKEIKRDDLVLSIDRETGDSVWGEISNIIIKPYSGKLNHIKTQHMDLLATNEHRFFFRKKREYGFMKVADLINIPERNSRSREQTILAGNNSNEDYSIDDNMISLVSWCLTDAHFDTKSNGITIYQSKKEYVVKIEKLLKNIGFTYSHNIRNREKRGEICGLEVKSQKTSHEFYINAQGGKEIREYCDSKTIPSWVWKLSKRQFDIFLNSLIDADGSRGSENSYCFYKKDKKMIDTIQALCIMNGYRTSVYEYVGRSNNKQYRLNLCERQISAPKSYGKSCKTVNYNGIIWDLTVPNYENFLVRRNGKAYFTGNSWTSKKGGYIVLKEKMNEHHCFYTQGVTYITINIGNAKYYITAAHRFQGSSMYNKNHPQSRALRFGGAIGSDIIVSGHTHQKSYQQMSVDKFGGESQVVHLINLGAYKSSDGYGRKLGLNKLNPENMFGSAVKLRKDEKEIAVHYDILKALE